MHALFRSTDVLSERRPATLRATVVRRLAGRRLAAILMAALAERAAAQQVVRPAVPVSGSCNYDMPLQRLATGGFRTVFTEDFGDRLDQWSAWSSGAYNQELQVYQPGNVSLGGGVLTIAPRRERASGRTSPSDSQVRHFDYTSGRIETRRRFSASPQTPAVRIVARIRLPRGYGMWPAFWTYGEPWPTEGEIDILEARGEDPFVFQTAYWYGVTAGTNDVQASDVPFRSNVDLSECWHVYDATWRRDSLTFRFDGQVVETKRGGMIPAMFGRHQKVALNVAVGGHFFNDLQPARIETGVMQVDWVRVLTGR